MAKTKLIKKEKLAPATKSNGRDSVRTAVVIADLEKQAKPHFAKISKIEKITSQEDFDLASLEVKALKEISKLAAAEEKDMCEGLKQSLQKIRDHFKPFQVKVAELELSTKLKMSAFLESQKQKQAKIDEKFESGSMSIKEYAKKTASVAVASTKGASKVAKVWQAEVVDIKKLPKEYMLPDMSKITAACREGVEIPGVKWEQVDRISI
jgi:hypothetical protein